MDLGNFESQITWTTHQQAIKIFRKLGIYYMIYHKIVQHATTGRYNSTNQENAYNRRARDTQTNIRLQNMDTLQDAVNYFKEAKELDGQ